MLANQAKSSAIAHGARLPFGLSSEPTRRDITATMGGPLILKHCLTVAPAFENDDGVGVELAARGAKVIKAPQD